jgi:hypothetical protein
MLLRGPGAELEIVSNEPDLLVMDASYDGNGKLPPPHLHPQQDEHFSVIEGRVRAIVDDVEQVYEPGDEFDVPAGAKHQMAAVDGPARFRWEVRPALRTAEFFERLYGGTADENFLEEFKDEFRLA